MSANESELQDRISDELLAKLLDRIDDDGGDDDVGQ
jgi:hypothetical protein